MRIQCIGFEPEPGALASARETVRAIDVMSTSGEYNARSMVVLYGIANILVSSCEAASDSAKVIFHYDEDEAA